MTSKEISEIRRRARRDRSNMTALHGCFVNDKKDIISTFRQSLGTMPENEADQFFELFRKILRGSQGKSLIDISFRTSQVADSEEHKLLMELRESTQINEAVLERFYQKVVESVTMDSSYLILVGCDAYDVPFKSRDAMAGPEDSEETFRYLLCAVCPVKLSKPAIEYKAPEQEFHNSPVSQVLTAPALGFMFPAFDDRSTNIYNALFYSKDSSANHEDFVTAVFNTKPFVPAKIQQKSFEKLLESSLEDECRLGVIQAVYDELEERIQLHNECNPPDPLVLDKEDVKSVLISNGVSEEKVAKFSVAFDETFGSDAQVPTKNVVGQSRFEVKTSDVTIRVNPNRSDLIETRVIGGVKYIMICADDDVEVNGVRINFTEASDD